MFHSLTRARPTRWKHDRFGNVGKNGSQYLPIVLSRVKMVFPSNVVHKKMFVDDHSVDDTAQIARMFNWEVFINPETGIPSGANEALRHVDCPFFVSVEQDVVLTRNWFRKISSHMNDQSVAVAQGVRIATEPTLRKTDERWLQTGEPKIKYLSMNNNIFRTTAIREIGGFPSECPICCDTILMKKLTIRSIDLGW